MDIDEVLEISLLYDFYGQLLSRRQREVMNLYHEENLSLAEIAAEFHISRQGVYDALKAGEKALRSYEDKLGLVKRFQETRELIQGIDGKLEELMGERSEDEKLIHTLSLIRGSIDHME